MARLRVAEQGGEQPLEVGATIVDRHDDRGGRWWSAARAGQASRSRASPSVGRDGLPTRSASRHRSGAARAFSCRPGSRAWRNAAAWPQSRSLPARLVQQRPCRSRLKPPRSARSGRRRSGGDRRTQHRPSRCGRLVGRPPPSRLVRHREHGKAGALAQSPDMGADRPLGLAGPARWWPRPGSEGAAGAAAPGRSRSAAAARPTDGCRARPRPCPGPAASSARTPGTCRLERRHHRLVRDGVLVERDVVADRVVEQQHLLRDVADALPPSADRCRSAKVGPSTWITGPPWAVEADQQVDDRGLADPDGPISAVIAAW